MTTKEKKPRVPKPDAEIVGSFVDAMKRGKCDDGRRLFALEHIKGDDETFVLAGTELQAWKALRPEIGTLTRMTSGKMSDRYREDALKLREEQNGEPETKTAYDGEQ